MSLRFVAMVYNLQNRDRTITWLDLLGDEDSWNRDARR